MTSETFYLFITVYLITITAIGLGVGIGFAVWAYKISIKRDELYQGMKGRVDEDFKRIREKLAK